MLYVYMIHCSLNSESRILSTREEVVGKLPPTDQLPPSPVLKDLPMIMSLNAAPQALPVFVLNSRTHPQ